MAPEVGIFLNVQHPPAVSTRQMVDDAVRQTALARDLGFDIVLAGQHFLTQPYHMLQPIPLLARIAAEAGEMRIGTGVLLLTLLNPVEVAEHVATLDAITGGRVVCGVGYGYRQEENDAFGLPERRIRIFEQKVEVLRALLAGEEVDAEGHGFRLPKRRLALLPVDGRRVPIWLAGNNDNGVERAARLGDGWLVNPHTALGELERQVGLYRAARTAAGLPIPAELPTVKELYVGADDATAEREAKPWLVGKYQAYVKWGQNEVLPENDTIDAEWEELKAGGRFIVGGPERCAAEIRAHVERLGITTFAFRFGWPGMPSELVEASMRRFAEQVRPLL